MSRYSVTLEFLIVCDGEECLSTFVHDLFDHLIALNDTADMAGALASGLFDFTLEVDAETAMIAVDSVATTVRTAAHAVGGNTSTWPTVDEWPDWIKSKAVNAHEVSEDDALDDDGDMQLVGAG